MSGPTPLVNYLSALTYAPGAHLGLWPARHLLAKDILRFHCVYWPALLLSAGYEVPRQLFVHGYLNLDGRGISKSLGNVIRVEDLTGVYGVDALRFWAARAVTLGQDADVTIEGFHERYERELANDLGNLLSRTTALIARSGGTIGSAGATESELVAAATTLGEEVPALFDRYEITAALDRIWDHIRRLNRYVEQTKPWELAREPERAEELAAVLYDLADGLRVVAVALWAYIPETSERILTALGQPVDPAWENAAPGRTIEASGITAAEPLFPRVERQPPRRDEVAPPGVRGNRRVPPKKRAAAEQLRQREGGSRGTGFPPRERADGERRGVIDTHAHLDALEEPSEVVARARAAGVTRIVTIGTGIDSCRRALDLTDQEGVYASLGIDPHQAGTDEAARTGELRALLAHPRAVAVGEAGLDYHYGADRKQEQRELFTAQLELARELELPVVVHTRAANADTEAILRGHDGTVVMHCFSEPELVDAGVERGWYFSFAGNVTYPEGRGAAGGCRGGARGAAPRRDRQPLPGAATGARPDERACERPPHAGRPRRGARGGGVRARGPHRGQCDRRVRVPVSVAPEEAARPALSRRREHRHRDRATRRAWTRTTSCSRSGRAWAC